MKGRLVFAAVGLLASLLFLNPANLLVGTKPVGATIPVEDVQTYSFAVIGNATAVREVNNIYGMLGSLGLSFKKLAPSEVTDDSILENVGGIISFVSAGGTVANASAVRAFAARHIVISDGFDFCHYYYPSLDPYYATVTNVSTVKYLINWGSFLAGDKPEMRSTDNSLRVIATAPLSTYPNVTRMALYNATYAALFHMGDAPSSGFYVMDLYAIRNSTATANNWHLSPALEYVHAIPVGTYARWMADGLSWHDLNWVNNEMSKLAQSNPDLVEMRRIGTTVEGRSINALFIGKGNRYVLVDGAMHGDEKTGTAACLRTAELLVGYYNSNNSYWHARLNSCKIIIVPVSNPDGYFHSTRENANQKDLNRDYPPNGNLQPTQPESVAFVNLMHDYPPYIYVNLHTGIFQTLFYQDSSDLLPEPFKTFALATWDLANASYVSLEHWGRGTNGGPLGQINGIINTALNGPVYEYAWWKYKTISCLLEFYDGSASVNLLGQEYFCSVIFAAIQNYDRNSDIQTFSTRNIENSGTTPITYTLNLEAASPSTESQTMVFPGTRGRPTTVVIDSRARIAGDGWSFNSSTDLVTIAGANVSVLLNWQRFLQSDVNQDGRVDGEDITLVALSYGTLSGNLRWNPNCDVNSDGRVDGKDIAIVALYFGQQYA